MTAKERFIELYRTHITREGAEELLEHIIATDFFIAPASTRFHYCHEGGLCEHSMNVFENLKKINETFNLGFSDETLAIVALLHDLCKINFYKIDFRNQKNEFGTWEKVPYYAIDDQFPYGHGEKSVYLIQCYMKLRNEEAMAIRWHMGGWDEAVRGGSYAINGAYDKYPLCAALHCADMMANYITEKKEPAK